MDEDGTRREDRTSKVARSRFGVVRCSSFDLVPPVCGFFALPVLPRFFLPPHFLLLSHFPQQDSKQDVWYPRIRLGQWCVTWIDVGGTLQPHGSGGGRR